MTDNQDIRWQQRFSNYNRALAKLREAVDKINLELDDEDLDDEEVEVSLSDLEKEGLIQRFNYSHELAWNVMKDYLEYQGNSNISGSRDATREAFRINLIENGETWMEMITSRNLTIHTYNEEIAEEVFQKIVLAYFPLFLDFQEKMETLRNGQQQDIFSNDQ